MQASYARYWWSNLDSACYHGIKIGNCRLENLCPSPTTVLWKREGLPFNVYVVFDYLYTGIIAYKFMDRVVVELYVISI
jgi:hypothetical protein